MFKWNKTKTHKQRVLMHLKKKGSITSLEAIKKYGNTRLGAYILQLRKEGYIIKTQRTSGKNRYGKKISFAKYILEA